MNDLIKTYRRSYQFKIILYFILIIIFCIPSYLFINHKLRGYVEAEPLEQVDAELRTLAQSDYDGLPFDAWFRQENMLNRTFVLDANMLLGPIEKTADGAYYLLQLDDEFFVNVYRSNQTKDEEKGRLIPVASSLRKQTYQYVKKHDYIEAGRTMETVISPYLLEVGYAGNVTIANLYWMTAGIILGIILVIWFGYRMMRYSPQRISALKYESGSRREREIMDYEVSDRKQFQGLLFGRHVIYLRIGFRKRIIVPLKYDHIIWYYVQPKRKDQTQLILYDRDHRIYHMNIHNQQVEITLSKLRERAPYAISGYQKKIDYMARHRFYELMKQVQDNRRETLYKKEFEDEHEEKSYEK